MSKTRSDADYKSALAGLLKNARAFNSEVAALAWDAITHYYEHSRSINRCRDLHDTLIEGGMGRQATALYHVLRASTPQTGVGTENWKGGKADAEPPEGYESVLSSIYDEENSTGNGSVFMSYAGEKKKAKSTKTGTKAKVLKLPDNVNEALVNSVQKALDGKTPAEVTAILTAAESGGVHFTDPETQEAYEEMIANCMKLDALGEKLVTVEVKGETHEFTARHQLGRVIRSARANSRNYLQDFENMQAALKEAANDAEAA